MKNIFKVKEPEPTKVDVQGVIRQIHNEFDTEVDLLLKEALQRGDKKVVDPDLVNKKTKLVELGFRHTEFVKKVNNIQSNINYHNSEINEKEILHEAIIYYSEKYPQYKFITEEGVQKICEKYGLVYGSASDYTGDIPESNINDILNMVIDEGDCCYEARYHIQGIGIKTSYGNKNTEPTTYETADYMTAMRMVNTVSFYKSELMIAASQKDMRMMERQEVKNYLILDIPDPVVLAPVHFKDRRYFLVITAWGLEASDGLVVNQKMN